jgi:hypothetical protein
MSQGASLVLERQPLGPIRQPFIAVFDAAAIRRDAHFGVPDPDVAGSVTLAAGTFDGDRVATRCRLSMTARVDGYRFRDRARSHFLVEVIHPRGR